MNDLRACVEEFPSDHAVLYLIAEGFTPGPMSAETLSVATLDNLIPNIPAYIVDESGHNAWVNSKAFEAAEIDEGLSRSIGRLLRA